MDGLLYAVGGHDGPLVRKSVEVYNPDTNSWSQVSDMHLCRRNAGRSLVLKLLAALDWPLINFNPFYMICSREVYSYDLLYVGVVANGGFLYVVGGDDGSSNLGSVECFDYKTNQWTLLPSSMMTGRSYAGVTVIDKPVLEI